MARSHNREPGGATAGAATVHGFARTDGRRYGDGPTQGPPGRPDLCSRMGFPALVPHVNCRSHGWLNTYREFRAAPHKRTHGYLDPVIVISP